MNGLNIAGAACIGGVVAILIIASVRGEEPTLNQKIVRSAFPACMAASANKAEAKECVRTAVIAAGLDFDCKDDRSVYGPYCAAAVWVFENLYDDAVFAAAKNAVPK